jgi:hypothetical protein
MNTHLSTMLPFYIDWVPSLEQAINLASLSVNVNVEIARGRRQSRDCLDVSGQCIPGIQLALR